MTALSNELTVLENLPINVSIFRVRACSAFCCSCCSASSLVRAIAFSLKTSTARAMLPISLRRPAYGTSDRVSPSARADMLSVILRSGREMLCPIASPMMETTIRTAAADVQTMICIRLRIWSRRASEALRPSVACANVRSKSSVMAPKISLSSLVASAVSRCRSVQA